MFRWAAAAAATVLSSAASPAHAADPPPRKVRLRYTVTAGAHQCPDEATLRNAVAARLGYEPFDRNASTIVDARIERRNEVLTGLIETRDKSGKTRGSRRITSQSDDCAELSSAMTLAISIAIDPLSLARPSPPAPTPAPPPAPAPKPPPPSPEPTAVAPDCPAVPDCPVCPAAPEPLDEPPAPVTFRASTGALVTIAAAPAVSVGFTAQLGLRYRALSVALEGRADLPAAGAGTEAEGEVATSLLLLSAVPCGHFDVLSGCIVASFGALRGELPDQGPSSRQHTFYAATGPRVAVELPIYGALAVRGHVDALATLTRTVLMVGEEEAWRTPPIQGSLGLAILGDFR